MAVPAAIQYFQLTTIGVHWVRPNQANADFFNAIVNSATNLQNSQMAHRQEMFVRMVLEGQSSGNVFSTAFVKFNAIAAAATQLLQQLVDDYDQMYEESVKMIFQIIRVPGDLETWAEARQVVRMAGVNVYNDPRVIRAADLPLRAGIGAQGLRFNNFNESYSGHHEAVLTYLEKKKSVYLIKNKDDLCFERSLAYFMVRRCVEYSKQESPLEKAKVLAHHVFFKWRDVLTQVWQKCKPSTVFIPSVQGPKLMGKTRIVDEFAAAFRTLFMSKGLEGPDLLLDLQDTIGVHIRIYDVEAGLTKVFEGTGDTAATINLLKDGNHVHPIVSLMGLCNKSYHCKDCDVLYDQADKHPICKGGCRLCRSRECRGSRTVEEAKKAGSAIYWKKCVKCNRVFPNDVCFASHQRGGDKSTCCTFVKCGESRCKGYNPQKEDRHVCGQQQCSNCKEVFTGFHRCYIKISDRKPLNERLLFFDFECTQERGFHEVTHVVWSTNTSEDFYYSLPDITTGDFSHVVNEFCSMLFAVNAYKGWTVLAHNGSGYDFQFILKWCVNHKMEIEKILRFGTRIKYMKVNGVIFIDSLSFLPMPLSEFPKTFALTELSKGYFPHMFNTAGNQLYVGAYPGLESYGVDTMRKANADKLRAWYATVCTQPFDFQAEIVKYCKSDVDILKRGCLSFQACFWEACETDPFNAITIAAACLNAYTSLFMPEKSICIFDQREALFCRRGFYGGRTNVMRAYHKAAPNETIKYVDVVSLYPWVNYTCEYPVGAPTWLQLSDATPDQICELINTKIGYYEVTIIPPTGLLLPVLPSRLQKSLQFCNLKIENGVYATPELRKALQKGYVIESAGLALVWDHGSKDLFREYVKRFIQIKQEASGWADIQLNGKQVETDAEKREWIRQYKESSGIELNFDKVAMNPGLRQVAKLALNSLWGKLCQRSNLTQSIFTADHNEVITHFNTKVISDFIDFDGMMNLTFSNKEEDDVPTSRSNVGVAAFTTSHARMKLYSGLEIVGDRAVYCDTDSVVYVSNGVDPDIPTGSELGEFKDELGGDHIVEWAAPGPKMYSYRLASGGVRVKSKGFSMTSNAEDVLNFENYKAAVLGEEFKSEVVTPITMVRNKRTLEIDNVLNKTKRFRSTLTNKGVYSASTSRLYPFGYEFQIDELLYAADAVDEATTQDIENV